MVRTKERYLLVNILYPREIGTSPDLPSLVLVNRPTTAALTQQALLRALRAEVATLFGDCGSAALEGGNLMGMSLRAFAAPVLLGPAVLLTAPQSSTCPRRRRPLFCAYLDRTIASFGPP